MISETTTDEIILEDRVEVGKRMIQHYMDEYHKNRWQNQPYYPEVFIEKKALQGVFEPICDDMNIALGACKGYPSLTFLHDAMYRFEDAIENDKNPIILYFGDYDPSGEDIPRSIKENLYRMGVDVEVRRIALMEEQVVEWNLPPAPIKIGDSRSASWDGLGQVELDAVEPTKIQELCKEAIGDIFNEELHDELMEEEAEERKVYRKELKQYVSEL